MLAEVPLSLLLGAIDTNILVAVASTVLLFAVPLCILTYVAVVVWRRLRRKASRFGYGGILEYLRAAPRDEAEKRDAVNLAMHGLVDCLLGIAFFPLLLIGIFPLYYGVRKVLLVALGIGPEPPPVGR